MKTSTLESKTVRPGLMRYSFYASERRPVSQTHTTVKVRRTGHKGFLIVVAVLAVAGGAAYAFSYSRTVKQAANTSETRAVTTPPKKSPAAAATPIAATAPVTTNDCAGNSLANFIKVSVSQRHLWACQGTQVVYDTPVVTGIEYLAADRTPVGTYKVYGKYTNLTLRGSDSTGSWSDSVSSWMPFLSNQYGQYGFHDATWRSNGDFGNIDPNSSNASHGCVELPLGSAQWLYNWTPVGTTVSIQT